MQVRYISQKYTSNNHTLEKYTFGSKKLGDGGDPLGDGVNLLGDGGNLLSIDGGVIKDEC